MKYNIFKKANALMVSAAFVLSSLSSCDERVDLTSIDEEAYTTSKDAVAYVVNSKGKRSSAFIELRNEAQSELFLALSNSAETDVQGAFIYNAEVLKTYNAINETDYELFPKDLVTFEGDLAFQKGTKKSTKVAVKLKAAAELDSKKTYVVPVSTQVKSGNIKLSEKESNYLIFVKDLSRVPDCSKPSGVKIVSCMEVNDTNPLNNLCFRLEGSGKPLVDIVVLFSANINYNVETGRVYVHNNENVQHLLDNHDKYLKPLQDRGMKVVLGILGNHDRSGIANLADETARSFAQELKTVCDAYQLDGVFFDDEYSKYQRPAPAGFVLPSAEAGARLCYETKQAMPDKLVMNYVYGLIRSVPDIDGHQAGTFIDYALHDYQRAYDLTDDYPGVPKSNLGMYSQEYNIGRWVDMSYLEKMRDNGYKTHMIFAMDPTRDNYARQKQSMDEIAEVFFGAKLEVFGKDDVKMEKLDQDRFYKKDW